VDTKEQLKRFLEPRSVAVIGVPRRTGVGDNVFENLLHFYHFSGRVYAVNPNATEILGHRVYPSIKEVPEVVDLAVLMVGRAAVPAVVRQCVDKGIKALAVTAQGLADSDEEGKRLQAEIVGIAQSGGARVIGPNSFGVANVFNGLNTAFIRSEMHRVPIGSVIQTGLFFNSKFMLVGKGVDIGNTCDIDFADCLEYFEHDQDVRLIALHIEGIKDGRRFIQVASRVARKKPILALKPGRSVKGANLTQSHSGSLAGNDKVYDAVFRQCGIIRVADVEELADLARAFVRLPPMRGRRVGMLTASGACAVMAADACQSYGMELAELSPETRRLITQVSPPWARPGNPIDLVPSALIQGLGTQEAFRLLLNALLRDKGVDGVIFVMPTLATQKGTWDVSAQASDAANSFPEKPVVCWLSNPRLNGSGDLYEQNSKVTVFPSVERCVRTLARLYQYHHLCEEQRPEEATKVE